MARTLKTKRQSTEQTRSALIAAALRLFGERGFEATSTRDIAATSKANIASIAYHFGSKQGLRLACAEMIITRIREVFGQTLLDADPGQDAEKALAVIETALTALARFLVMQSQGSDIAAFVIREMTQPSAALDLIYTRMMGPFHIALCRLWGIATRSDPQSAATRLAVFSILGQLIYFRIGQPIVLKRMDWKKVGSAEADQIIAVVMGNIRALAATSLAATSIAATSIAKDNQDD